MSFLDERLDKIRAAGVYRTLPLAEGVDFWSNDYLGLARAQVQGEVDGEKVGCGATGSRLISGNSAAAEALEERIAAYHGAAAALLFPSGYAANLGLLSAVLRRGDLLLYDELVHASCRDGLRLGQARSYRFAHNDLEDLRRQLEERTTAGQVFVLTESRFSMDGDVAPLMRLAHLCAFFGAHLIVDEAHSGGLDGARGGGLVARYGLQDRVFATVITYGKAFGTHGAAVLGATALREYLINTCRPFIYSTGLAPAQLTGIAAAYDRLEAHHGERLTSLVENVSTFQSAMAAAGLGDRLLVNEGPIQILGLPGNAAVMTVEEACRTAGLLVKGIRSPTVAAGSERLRICLHAFNTGEEIERLARTLADTLADC